MLKILHFILFTYRFLDCIEKTTPVFMFNYYFPVGFFEDS